MFHRRPEAPLLSQAGLQSLCASLNAPVVNVSGHPVGPARAVIVVFAGDYGGLGLCIAVRAQDAGALSFFHYSGGSEDFPGPAEALEHALAFAEGMGFLFDEELVGREGREAAFAQWQTLTGEEPMPELEVDATLEEELVLEEVACLDEGPLELDLEPDSELLVDLESPATPAPEAPPVPPATPSAAGARSGAPATDTLTKFRRPATAGPRGPNELGRIALVRRRGDPGRATPAIQGIRLKLLGGF